MSFQLKGSDFGEHFVWGTATASYQIEGGWQADGKGESIWDRFSHTRGKILTGETGDTACDFFHRYGQDLRLMGDLGIQHFRFSLAWPRILPNGTGQINQKGLDFYKRVLEACALNNITPWVTLYHWDLPQTLQDKGGWVNRDIVNWFSEYTEVVAKALGDSIPHWMVLNEPTSFVSLGYMLGLHAPGKKGIGNFLPVAHHANLVQGAAGRILRQLCPQAEIGTTNYFSSVQPRNPQSSWDVAAAKRFDAVINRLYVDPIVGRGYPTDVFPLLRRIEKYFQPNDEQLLPFDFDFLGLQTYSRDVIKWTLFQPIIWGTIIPPEKRGVTERTAMGWEVYPEGIYELLKRFGSYPEIKKIYVTENGTAFPDPEPHQNRVPDPKRTAYLQQHIQSVYRAKQEGVPVEGYFVWSFMDNFEWHEGFRPRFGLVYLDYATQDRYVKDSGRWFSQFIRS